MSELIRRWVSPCGRFSLKVYDEYKWSGGRRRLTYKFYSVTEDNPNRRRLIFGGGTFGPSPLHSDDSDETLGAILAPCALRPGDTDADYFENYNQRQMDFARMYGEELSMYAMELEGAL